MPVAEGIGSNVIPVAGGVSGENAGIAACNDENAQ